MAATTSSIKRLALVPLFLVAGPAAVAWADQAALLPPESHVELRTYGLGLLPFDGRFTRFHGWLRSEATNPVACQVLLEIEAGSLAMDDASIGERITGPEYMDVGHFPGLAFHGGCQGDTIAGSLTLHGQTHPFALDLKRSARSIVATGHLQRAEWGMAAHPLIGGSTIRIRVEFPNPAPGTHT